MNILHAIGGFIATVGMMIGSFFGIIPQQQQFGNFNPTGGQTYRLQSSIGTSDTSITLSSFKEPVSNIKYTMSYLNSSIEYGTLDPQTNTKEFISFTGITQNSDGTAQLTGVTRGLSFSYPYTASTTLQQAHAGQSIFILSNPPQLTNQYGNKNNDDTISGLWTFTTSPYGSTPTTTTQLATKGYVDGVAIAGAPNANTTTKGISQLSTGTQAAASTGLGSTGASLVLPASIATSTSQVAQNSVVVSNTSGKIDPSFLNGTENYTWNGTGLHTASTTFSATTTIVANSQNNALVLNGVPYTFPATQGASSTMLQTNGAGSLSWNTPTIPRYSYQGATASIASIGYATSSLYTIPANVMTASSTISVEGSFSYSSTAGGVSNCNIILRKTTGETFATAAMSFGAGIQAQGIFHFQILPTYSVTSQTSYVYGGGWYIANAPAGTGGYNVASNSTSAINLANQTGIVLVVQGTNNIANCTVDSSTMTVNP